MMSKTKRMRVFGALTYVLLSFGSTAFAAEDLVASLKDKLNIPAGFSPKEKDFAPDKPQGRDLAIDGNLRGRQLKDINGVRTIYILEVPKKTFKDRFKSEPFKVGDLIFAVNGAPFKGDAIRQFKQHVSALRDTGGKLTFGRLRKGVAATAEITIMGPTVSLTTGGSYDPGEEDWNLGATGADGWIWASSRETTQGAKEIYITQVRPSSPAAGKLFIGDVLLGANGKPFVSDARKEFANALTESETTEKGGTLELKVWKDGKTRDVTLSLKALGSYSDLSLESEKVQKIIDDACRHLKEKGVGTTFSQPVNALGLLATGREDVMPVVREYAKRIAEEGKDLDLSRGMASWYWSYANLFLAEYYLATRDESVLPAIREYATKMAMGQSQVGTWGHKMCEPWPFEDAPLYGICPGYGAMNQIGVTCMISLTLAKKCGVTNDAIELALRRGTAFFKFCVDKGTLPYGDHAPNVVLHEDNGKSSQAAVMFDLLGEKKEAAFFARMTLASYDEREIGHTGNYWNMLWGPLGAACGGDAAASAFMKKMAWYFDFERRHDGSFIYQGKPGVSIKFGGENSNKNWDCTGARLLAYCLPLKKLYITGKGRVGHDFTGHEVSEAVAAGGFTGKESTQELLGMLESWSPVLRDRAARALENKPENVAPQLIAMLDSGNPYARYGACQGLCFAGRQSEVAAAAIIAKGVNSEDPLLRYFAMYAFSSKNETMGLSAVAMRAVPDLLKMAVQKNPNDPMNRALQELTVVLFNIHNSPPVNPIFPQGMGIENVDSELLVPAIREMLKAKNAGARGNVAAVFDNLKVADREKLWNDIYQCAREQPPSGEMYAHEPRLAALKIMTDLHTREGLQTAVWFLTNQRVRKAITHTATVLNMIKQYGGYAKEFIPEMKKAADRWEKGTDTPVLLAPDKEMAKLIRDTVNVLESAPLPKWKMNSNAGFSTKSLETPPQV